MAQYQHSVSILFDGRGYLAQVQSLSWSKEAVTRPRSWNGCLGGINSQTFLVPVSYERGGIMLILRDGPGS